MNLSEIIKTARQAKGYTLAEVEEKTGISEGYLSRLEKGSRIPSLETLLKLSNCLELPKEVIEVDRVRLLAKISSLIEQDYDYLLALNTLITNKIGASPIRIFATINQKQ